MDGRRGIRETDDRRARRGVRETYDRIATHFAATREHAWPEVEVFLAEHGDADRGGIGLDVGCGNGRHVTGLAAVVDRVIGVDVSRELLGAARERCDERSIDVDLVQADAVSLPLVDDCVDLGVYVATLHHVPTREGRVGSLDELARVLAGDGVAIVSAWSVDHERFDASEGFDTTIDWTLPDGETVGRFYHIYDREEFEADLNSSRLEACEVFVSSGNCYAVVASQ